MDEQLVPVDSGMSALTIMNDEAMFNRMVRFAQIMATGKATIPKELQNEGDCMAITMQAMNWKMNPFSVAQKTHFINGKIGFEAQLVAAAVENSGAIVGGFHFEWFGPWEKVIGKFEIKRNSDGKEYRVPGWALKDEEGIGVRVSATKKGESEPRTIELLLAQARTRNSTLWADDPKMQIAYLGEKKWCRLYTPGVLLGVYTPDELEDPVIHDVTPEFEGAGHAAPETVFYTNEEFAANKAAWKEQVIEKKRDNARFIAFIESKGKKFTEAQKAEIMSWKAIEQPKEDPGEPEQQQTKQEVKDSFVDAMNAAEAQQGAK
jgi:hypothetical protein